MAKPNPALSETHIHDLHTPGIDALIWHAPCPGLHSADVGSQIQPPSNVPAKALDAALNLAGVVGATATVNGMTGSKDVRSQRGGFPAWIVAA